MAETNLLVLAREFKKLREDVKQVLQMPKGDKGDKGEKGDKGDPGSQGPQGLPGRDGKDGLDGRNGRDGRDGVNGADGADGIDGVSVVNAEVTFDNALVLKLSDGTEIDAGQIRVDVPSGTLIVNNKQTADLSGLTGGTQEETSPVFTYTSGVVSRIDYDSGNYKTFTYTSGVLTQLDYVIVGDSTIRKVFTYNEDGTLASIAETVV